MLYGNDKVITGNVVLAWDGLRNPEHRQSGSINYNVTVLIPKDAPEVAELNQIATAALTNSEFRGQLPVNGHWPLNRVADPAKFGPQYNNHLVIGAGSNRGICSIVDVQGNPMDIMAFGPMLYPGCVMKLLVHAYAYNNINKGISFGLDGIQIVDPKAPQLPVGGGMSQQSVASAFGGTAPAPGMAGSPPAPAAPAPGMAGPPPAPMAPPANVMTPKATYSYDEYKAAGWSDDQLRAGGLMQ